MTLSSETGGAHGDGLGEAARQEFGSRGASFRHINVVRHVRREPSPWGSGSPIYWRSRHARLLRRPRDTWAHLLDQRSRLRYSFLAVLGVGIGYAVTAAGIALSGGTPSTPWLAIQAADYFKTEVLFITPVTVLCWILAGGVMYLLGRLFHGVGTFDDTLVLLGFAIALSTLVTLIPDSVRALLTTAGALNRRTWENAVSQPGTVDFVFLWADMLGYLLALLCLFSLSASVAHHLRRWPAFVVGLASVVAYQGVYIIFIR